MFRVPKSRIVLFVTLSMMTAFAYHQWYLPRLQGEASFSSKTVEQLTEQSGQILSAAGGVVEVKTSSMSDGCQCTVAGVDNALLRAENLEKDCDPERRYLETDLQKIDRVFRDERATSSADFPKVCLTYILRSTNVIEQSRNSNNFVDCRNPKEAPVRGYRKACITNTYINSVYNIFVDMADCFGAPARDYLPKLSMESGFHLNIMGAGEDSGIAQFVGVSIKTANEDFEANKRFVAKSDRESCQRLAPYVKTLNPIGAEIKERCGLMTAPENPMLSLFYMMTKYRKDMRSIENYMEKSENKILEKMKNLGLSEQQFDREKLKQILMILAYNAGAGGGVSLLSNYLDAVKLSGRKLELSDFDIGAESFIYRKINSITQLLRRQPANTDEIWAKRKLDFELMAAELSKGKSRFKPEVEKLMATDDLLGDYETYRLNFRPGDLTFAAYTMLYQTVGGGGYLPKVRDSANKLNQVFKEGVCVPESYLAL